MNRGANTFVVGVPVKAEQDGANIKPGAGTFDVYYRPDCEVIIVNEAGAALSYWGVVGTINGWGAPDKILYQNADGLLESAEIELTATDEIKIRQNEDWGVNRGGTFVALGEAFAVEHNGPNIALSRDAKVQVVYDAANETITIKGEFVGDAPAFPEDIYAIGGDTGWSTCYQLHGKNGKLVGFGYLSQEFKFKPNADSWDGDWECVGEGQIGQGSDNCPAPATAGYYMIEVDLNEMTYKLTLITTIGIIGPAQAGGWDADTDLTYNAESGAWEASGVALSAGDMKFRANDAWDINWGGALDALTQGGDNIAVAAGTYDVKLFALCDTKAYATLTEAAGPAAGITIDGNMADWAGIDAISTTTNRIVEWKYFSDATNLYFYYKITAEKIKTDSANYNWDPYIYIGLDTDNNTSTGTDGGGGTTGGCEAQVCVFPWRGAVADGAPTWVNGVDENGWIKCPVSGESAGNPTAFGYIEGEWGYLEISIPRSLIGSPAAGTIAVDHSMAWYVTGRTEITLN